MTPPNFLGQGLLAFALLLLSITSFSQTTMNSSGNWSNAALWSNTVGDAITENVTLANNTDATIQNGQTYTIGTLTMSNGSKLTIKATTGRLNVGQSGTPKNMTANNNTVITVEAGATLEIWGSFTTTANVQFNVSGTLRVHGSMAFSGNNSNVQIGGTGRFIIDGAMSAGNNTNFNNNGYVEVGGSMAVGNGSNLNGNGTFRLGGTCSGPNSWCNNSMLPVELLWFRTKNTINSTELVWSTASEKDVDFFALEKSLDGETFFGIGNVAASGNSGTQRIYSFIDEKPVTGTSYFKLNEVTIQGERKELSIIRNNFDGKKQVTISPNPLEKDQPLSFSLNFRTTQQYEIAVYDVRGMMMGRTVVSGNDTSIPVDLSAGVYIVRVSSPEINSVQRIIVR